MQISINSQALASELRLLNRVVPTKPAIAILSHALLTAADGRLAFWATDLEVGLSTACAASIAAPGRTALPVARLLSLCEQFPDADVEISAENGRVRVACGAFRSQLQSLPADDFPAQPAVDGVASALDAAAFRQLIARTRYAINAQASKVVVQGALLTLAGPVAAMAATDGKRLALATMSRSGPDAAFTIPAKALDLLAVGSEIGVLEVTVGARSLHFAAGDRAFVSRMLEGAFPAYERIIPRDNEKVATIDRAALAAALRRIVLVAEENKAVYLELSSDRIALSSASADVGQAAEEIACRYAGEKLRVCVNGDFVLDFLDAASNSAVTLAFKDARSAMLLTDGDDHVGVVILMRGN